MRIFWSHFSLLQERRHFSLSPDLARHHRCHLYSDNLRLDQFNWWTKQIASKSSKYFEESKLKLTHGFYALHAYLYISAVFCCQYLGIQLQWQVMIWESRDQAIIYFAPCTGEGWWFNKFHCPCSKITIQVYPHSKIFKNFSRPIDRQTQLLEVFHT